MTNKVKVTNLHKSFGKLDVLKGVDMEIKEGEVVTVIGPSGSGKSTLLRCLNRLEESTSGEIIVDGYLISDKHTDINKVRENIGMVFQQFNLFPHLTVKKNIMMAPVDRKKMTKAEAEAKALELLKRVGLEDKADVYPRQLSGGQQQRVAIARAIVTNPSLILADEPTGNLDPVRSLELMLLFEKINEMGTTILVVTHEKELVNAFAKRVITIDNGHVISDGMDGYYSYEIE